MNQTYPHIGDNRPLDEITGIIVDEIYQTYRHYGPGLFERVYEASLAGRLKKRGLSVVRQKQIFISDEFVDGEPAFFADLEVSGKVLVELKSVEKLTNLHKKQLRTYLRLTDKVVGILVNFDCTYLKDNVTRVVNNYEGAIGFISYTDIQ
ncbi:MAG: GxxExxY protein [Lewinella sp.]